MEDAKSINFAFAAREARAQVPKSDLGFPIPETPKKKRFVWTGQSIEASCSSSRGFKGMTPAMDVTKLDVSEGRRLDVIPSGPSLGKNLSIHPDPMSIIAASGAKVMPPVTGVIWGFGAKRQNLGIGFQAKVAISMIKPAVIQPLHSTNLKPSGDGGSPFVGIQYLTKEKAPTQMTPPPQPAPTKAESTDLANENAALRAQLAKLAGDLALLQIDLSILKKG